MRRGWMGAAAIAVMVAAVPVAFPAMTGNAQPKTDQTGGTTNFVRLATQASLFEVQSSRLALQRSNNEAVRGFAQMMIKDHEQELNNLKFTNDSNASAPLPKELDPRFQGIFERLQATTGPSFDNLYMQIQVRGHEEALALYRSYAEVGEVESLRKLARNALPIIERHRNDASRIAGTLPQ
jgi:putative membrane protein